MSERPPFAWYNVVPNTRGTIVTDKPGIYQIRHQPSGKVYVGSAASISKRWYRHRHDLALGIHKNAHLQAAWRRDGPAAFVFEVLELTTDLGAREQYWLDRTGCCDAGQGYNALPVARSSRGVSRGPLSDAVKAKIRAAQIGVPRPYALGNRSHSKLTEAQADELRARFGHLARRRGPKPAGEPNLAAIGALYGISQAQVCMLLQGKTYRKEVMPYGPEDTDALRQ